MLTFHWHKEMLKFLNLKKYQGGTNKSIKSTEKRDENRNDSFNKRRQVVLSTVMHHKDITLQDVAGLNAAKEILKEAIIMPLQFPHLFTGKRRSWTRILLYGPPGTGKSRLGQAIAGEIKSTFFSVSSADLLSSFVGESEKVIKELFSYARLLEGYSIIFIDEIDSISRQRSSREEEHTRRIKTELLKQMDGINTSQEKDNVFLLCATNCPWELDIAFLRRFQRRIYIPLPDRLTRMQIIRLHLQGGAVNVTDCDWNVILDKTQGFSGSDLATLVMNALFEPLRELKNTVCWTETEDGYLKPSYTESSATVRCSLQELPLSKVLPRDANLNDFLSALNTTHQTIPSQEIDRYEEFTKLHGQFG